MADSQNIPDWARDDAAPASQMRAPDWAQDTPAQTSKQPSAPDWARDDARGLGELAKRGIVQGGASLLRTVEDVGHALNPAAAISNKLTEASLPPDARAGFNQDANPLHTLATRADEYAAPAPGEAQPGIAGKVVQGVSKLVPEVAGVIGSGGESAVPEALTAAARAVPYVGRVLGGIAEGVPAAAKFTAVQSSNLPENLTPTEKATETAKALGENVALAGLPVAAGKSLLARIPTGAALGYAQSAGLSAVEGQPQDTAQNIVGAIQGGAFGAIPHGAAEGPEHPSELQRAPATPSGPISRAAAALPQTAIANNNEKQWRLSQGNPIAQDLDPEQANRAAFEQRLSGLADSHGLDSPALETARQQLYQPLQRDRVTGFYKPEELDGAVKRAQGFAAQTGQPATYVEADLQNLGGLNAKLGTSGADTHMAQIANGLYEHLQSLGDDVQVTPVRKGGDEFAYVVTGAPPQDVHAAANTARDAISDYAKQQGLDQIPRKGGTDPVGVGIHFGLSEIPPEGDLRQVFQNADRQVEARKVGGSYEFGSEAGSSGAESSGERSESTESGTGAPVGERPAGPTLGVHGADTESGNDQAAAEVATGAPVGIANAAKAQERAARNLGPLEAEGKRDFGTVWERARQTLAEDPQAGNRLANEVSAKPRALNAEESAVLIQHGAELNNRYDSTLRDIDAAQKTGNTADEAQAQVRRRELEEQLQVHDQAARQSGYEQGLGLAMRNALANRDYSMARQVARFRAIEGGDIPEGVRSQLDTLTKQVADLNDRIKQRDAQLAQRPTAQRARNAPRSVQDQHEQLKAELARVLGNAKTPNAEPANLVRASRTNEAAKPGAGMKREDLAATISDAVKGWTGDAPRIAIHQSHEEAPESVVRSQGFDKQVEGAYDAGTKTVHMFADSIHSPERAKQVLAHEVVGHYGVQHVVGKDWGKLVDDINRLSNKPPAHLRSVFDEVDRRYPGADGETRASEALAVMAEHGVHNSLMDRALAAVRRFLRKIGLNVKFNDAEIRQMLVAAKRRVEGGQPSGASAQGPGVQFSKPETGVDDKVATIVKQMARNRVAAGESDPRALIDWLHGEVGGLAGLSRQQVHSIVAGVQSGPKPTRTELQQRMDGIRTQLRQELKNPEAQRNTTRQAALQRQIEDIQRRITSGDFSKVKRAPFTYNEDTFKLEVQRNRLQRQLDTLALKREQAQKNPVTRFADFLIKLHRFNILSSPRVVPKLLSAATAKIAATPLEELAGSVLKKIPGIDRVAAMAPRHGAGFTAGAEREALHGAFSRETLQGMKDQVLHGHDALDELYGDKLHKTQEWTNFMGNIHSALKEPAMLNEFYRSYFLRAQHERARVIGEGMNPEQADEYMQRPSTQAMLGAKAYADGTAAKMQGKNAIADAIDSALRTAQQQGGPTSALAKLFNIVFPIRKVPLNIVKEISSYAVGGVKAGIGAATWKGELTPDRADYIMKNLKQQTVGTALLALGYAFYQNFGGTHQEGDSKRSPNVKPGEAKINGVDVPELFFHSPAAQTVQIGAGLARIYRQEYGNSHNWFDAGLKSLLANYGSTLKRGIPYLDQPRRIDNTVKLGRGWSEVAGNQLRSMFVPQVVQQVAQAHDPYKGFRKPKNIAQDLELGVPGLRETVPR